MVYFYFQLPLMILIFTPGHRQAETGLARGRGDARRARPGTTGGGSVCA